MFKQHDQAEGLRRMMSHTQPKMISVISVTPGQDQLHLFNVAASLQQANQRLLLIQHQAHTTFTAPWPSLSAVARGESTRNLVTRVHPLGFDCAYLIENNGLSQALSTHLNPTLTSIVNDIAAPYDTVMIETQLTEDHALLLPFMAAQSCVIQMGRHPDSIKAAYSCIKHLCERYGDRPFGILVQRATELQAQQAFLRLQQVCLQFLGISLQFVGAIPEDDALQQSHALGRSVLDAFPKAQASIALKTVASRLAPATQATLVAA